MANEEKKGNEEQGKEQELEDIEIAELANKKLKEKDKEIADLKKQLAKEKLLSEGAGEEEVVETKSREEILKVIANEHTTNYDYAKADCDLVDLDKGEGNPNPLGENGDEVYDFFKDVLETCGEDKSKFVSVYQAMIGPDDKNVSMAFNARNKRK